MRNSWKKTAAFVLAFTLVAAPLTQTAGKGGLFGGSAITAKAAGGGTEVTQANVICQQYSYMDADPNSYSDTPPADITNIELADAQAFGAAVNCPTTYWVVVYAKDGDNLKWTSNGKTGEQTSTPITVSGRVISAWYDLYNGDVFSLDGDPMKDVTFYFSKGLATVDVSGVQLNKTETNLTVGGSETLTAVVSPDGATDKTVTWSSSNTDVATVDANGKVSAVGAGSATITATATNGTEDTSDDKTATCTVTVKYPFTAESITIADFTYDGTEKTPVLKYGDTTLVKDTDYTIVETEGDTASATNAGEYTIHVSGMSNYTGANIAKTWKINKKDVSVTAEAKSKTCGEDDPELTYTHGDLFGSDAFTGALTRAEGEDAGTYAITQGTLSAGDNYNITFTGADFTIKKIPFTLTGAELTYNGDAQNLISGDVPEGTLFSLTAPKAGLDFEAESQKIIGWVSALDTK